MSLLSFAANAIYKKAMQFFKYKYQLINNLSVTKYSMTIK